MSNLNLAHAAPTQTMRGGADCGRERVGSIRRCARTVARINLGLLVIASSAFFFEAQASSCEQLEAEIQKKTGAERIASARTYVTEGCLTPTSALWRAIETGVWSNGDTLSSETSDRAFLVKVSFFKGFAAAETLVVSTLQSGVWPDGDAIVIDEGIVLVEALEAKLTPYRIGLLLDIYEQIPNERVRIAVVQTLRASQRPEAILPALDAFWTEEGELKNAANTSIGLQPEQEPKPVLTRLARELDDETMRSWIRRLAEAHQVPEALKALDG